MNPSLCTALPLRLALWSALPLLCLLLAPEALAKTPPGIGPGREAEALQLLRPYADQGEVVPGVVLAGVQIQPDRLVLKLHDAAGPDATLTLWTVPSAPNRPPPKSFRPEPSVATTPALQQAQTNLLAAVARNDTGSFAVGAPVTTPNPAMAQENVWADPGMALRLALAVALWLLLGVAVVRQLRQRVGDASCGGRIGRWIAGLIVVSVAFGARSEAPFTPLHANDHAYEDIAVALGTPESGPATVRAVVEYGPSWVVAQRATVPLFGRTHDGLARWSAAVGALAALFAFLAATQACGTGSAGLLAGLVVALAPVAVRVGHSESVLVVAQLLVAVGLWLAVTAPNLANRLGLLAVVGLLATGHPLGPAYAAGVAALAWAVERGVDPSGRVAPDVLLPWRSRLGWAAALAGVVAAGLALGWLGDAGLLARRVAVTSQEVPISTGFWRVWLWLDPAWSSVAAVVLATLGWMALPVHFATPWQDRTLRTLAFGLGLGAVALPGLVVTASVTDALRYQAPFAGALAVAIGFAPALVQDPLARGRWPRVVVVLLVALAVLVELGRDLPGETHLDVQAQAYQGLRRAVGKQPGEVWLLQVERDGAAQVVVEAPVGRLAADGPTLRVLSVRQAEAAGKAGRTLPRPLYVFLDPGCEARVLQGSAGPCAALERWAQGLPVARGTAKVARASNGVLPDEFHAYRTATPGWSLFAVTAPPPLPRPAGR